MFNTILVHLKKVVRHLDMGDKAEKDTLIISDTKSSPSFFKIPAKKTLRHVARNFFLYIILYIRRPKLPLALEMLALEMAIFFPFD